MPDQPLSTHKHGVSVQVAQDLQAAAQNLTDFLRGFPAALDRALNATPEQRAEWARQAELREAEAAQERADERARATRVPLTVEALAARMGWTPAYAEHLVQPYCECGDDIDGWTYCQHAQDQGLAP